MSGQNIPQNVAVAICAPAYAATYMSVEQAQALMFPGASFTADFRALTDAQVKAIEAIYGDPQSAIAGAVRAQEFFERYSWERDRRRLFETMDEVAKR